MKKKIIPQVQKCVVCVKRKPISHHLKCDKCWEEEAKIKYHKKRKEFLVDINEIVGYSLGILYVIFGILIIMVIIAIEDKL